MTKIASILLWLTALPAIGAEITLEPQPDPSLLFAQLRANPTNMYRARLIGEKEKGMREMTKCKGDIVMMVKEIKRYSPTCMRIGFATVLHQTPTSTVPINFVNKIEFDLCNDGTVPKEAMNLEVFAQEMMSRMKRGQ